MGLYREWLEAGAAEVRPLADLPSMGPDASQRVPMRLEWSRGGHLDAPNRPEILQKSIARQSSR